MSILLFSLICEIFLLFSLQLIADIPPRGVFSGPFVGKKKHFVLAIIASDGCLEMSTWVRSGSDIIWGMQHGSEAQ